MKGGQDHGRGKGKAVGHGNKKRFKSKDKRIIKYYGCKQIGHWKRECPNKSDNSSLTNVVLTDGSFSGEDLLCVSSVK